MTPNNQDLPKEQAIPEASMLNNDAESPVQEKGHSATTPDYPSFGWSFYAERINGRFAMVGFGVILIVEALSNDSFLHWSGLIP